MNRKFIALLKSASWSVGTCLLGLASYPLGYLMAYLFGFEYNGQHIFADGAPVLLGIAIVGASFLDYALAGKDIDFPKRRGLTLGFVGFVVLLLNIVVYAAVTTQH